MKNRNATLDVQLNLNVRGLTPSATLAVNERCARLRAEGRPVYRLGLGQSPFPVPLSVVEALQANAHQKDYLPVMGLPELREAVSDWLRRTQGISRGGGTVLVGPGSKELMFLLQLVYYGDLVIPTPSWVSYAPQARIVGRQVVWVPTSGDRGWHLTPEELDRVCRADRGRPRIVILNYPANPTGNTYKTGELRDLARVARDHKVVLVSDEIYGELHHKGQHVSVARFYPEGTIVSGGLSKWCGAGGWRLGIFSFPPGLRWLQDAMGSVASETYTSTSAPIQHAAVRAYQGGMRIERYLWNARRILGALCRSAARVLGEAGAEVVEPRGGFYIFPDFSPLAGALAERGIRTGRDLCERLLEEAGVAVLPGAEFGRPEEELTARISCVDFDGARALAAAEETMRDTKLGESFLRSWCGRTLEAAERIAEWLPRNVGA
jgi:aspartate aminotransferase